MRKISVAVMMLLFMGLAGAMCFAGEVKKVAQASSGTATATSPVANAAANNPASVNSSTVPTSLAGQNIQASTVVVQVPAPKQEDLVALHIGTTTVMADMTGIAPDRRESIVAYLQGWFDYVMDKMSDKKLANTSRKLNITDSEQVLTINVLSKMLTDAEYGNRTAEGLPYDSVVKVWTYNAFTQLYYEKCVAELDYESCATKRLLPVLKSNLDYKWKSDVIEYLRQAINDFWNNNVSREKKEKGNAVAASVNMYKYTFGKKNLYPIMDAFITEFRNKQNEFIVRKRAAFAFMQWELRCNILDDNFKFMETEPKLFNSLNNGLAQASDNCPQLPNEILVILEHPHEYPEEIVKGAYWFIVGDSTSFRYDPDGSRRQREKRILYSLKADKDMAKLLPGISGTLWVISDTERRKGLK